jgi:hypothetical protein
MATYYWVGGSGTWDGVATANWSASSGGAGGSGPPLSGDTVIFDDNSGTGTCTTAAGSVSNLITLNSSNLILNLGANHTNGGSFTFTKGALDLDGFTLSASGAASSGTGIRSIAFGTGKVRLTGSGFTVWNFANLTNFSYTGTPTVELSANAASGNRTLNNGFQGGASEANAVSFYITAGTDTINANNPLYAKTTDFTGFSGTRLNFAHWLYGDLVLSSTMSLNAGTVQTRFLATSGAQNVTTNGKTLDFPLIVDAPSATVAFQDALTLGATRSFTLINGTVKLKDGATTTVGSFVTSSTNQKFLQSTVAGSQATLSQAGGTVNANNLTIKDINATGGATWNAYTTNNNVDAGNNLGWDFSLQIGRCIYTRRKNKRILP